MEQLFCIASVAVAAYAAALAVGEARRRRRALRGADAAAVPSSPITMMAQSLGHSLERLAVRAGWTPACPRTGKLLAAAGVAADRSFTLGAIALRALGVAFAALLAALASDRHRLAAAILGASGAWLFAELALRRRARMLRESIERELPFALDLLTLCVEAGLDFAAALARVAARLRKGALATEFGGLDASLRMGVPRREALSQLARRGAAPSLASLCALLVQADRLGTGVGPALRATSARLRSARFARAEKRGAIAAQMALLPLIFCIMPATFIVVFGPLFVRVATGGIAALF